MNIQRNIPLRSALALLVCVSLGACATTDGPDGSSDAPAIGKTFYKASFAIDEFGRPILTSSIDSIKSTVAKSQADASILYAISIIDSSVRNGRTTGLLQVLNYQFWPNGDVSIQLPPNRGTGGGVSINEIASFARFPCGTKHEYDAIVYDSSSTSVNSKGDTVVSHFQIRDRGFVVGPALAVSSDSVARRYGLFPGTTMVTGVSRIQQVLTIVNGIAGLPAPFDTTTYTGWYAVDKGVMVQFSTLRTGRQGTEQTVIPASLQ
jgi:hypothetical protein